VRLNEIPEKENIEFRFKYQNTDYCMDVNVQLKMQDMIFIQAVCSNGKPIEAGKIKDALLSYKVDGGIYNFIELTLKLVTYQGNYLYGVTSEFEPKRMNRREAFRAFVGEAHSLKLIKNDGNVVEFSGLLKDISLNGIGFIMNRKVDDIAYIKVVIDISKNCKLPLLGEIVRVTELPKHRGYLYGCKLNIHSDILNRYVLKCQLKNKITKEE
jgi:hypothetical protein